MITTIDEAVFFLKGIGQWDIIKDRSFYPEDREKVFIDIANLHKKHNSTNTWFFYGGKGFCAFSNELGVHHSYRDLIEEMPNTNVINYSASGMTNPSVVSSLYTIPTCKSPNSDSYSKNRYSRYINSISDSEYPQEIVLISSHPFEDGMKKYEIWCSGYRTTGEHSPASLIGKSHGYSFEDAVRNFTYPKDVIRSWDGEILNAKGSKIKLDNYKDRLSIWGCTLYDNEKDARKSFG